MFSRRTTLTAALALPLLFAAGTALANHSWGTYHWARTSNPLPLKLGDNVTNIWDSHLTLASSDWNVSPYLKTSVVTGQTAARTCKPVSGTGQVCNSKYGNTGWLGIAQIWINGSHITQGIVKLNDTYFNTAKYNTPAWRNLVTCQEVGHLFGLGHQDENFSNAALGTCMDYTSDPTPNQHPNQHDFDQLALIYEHLDATNTFKSAVESGTNKGGKPADVGQDIDLSDPSAWGEKMSDHVYVLDLGKGKKVFTDVFWIEGRAPENHHD